MIQSDSDGEPIEMRVRGVRPAAADPGALRVPDLQPGDCWLDPAAPPVLETRRLPSGHLLVRARVEGAEPGWFFLDSGAAGLFVTPRVSRQAGLARLGALRVRSGGGNLDAGLVRGARLTVGPLTLWNPLFAELDLGEVERILGLEVAGILGYDLFRRAVVVMDPQRGTAELHDPFTYRLPPGRWQDRLPAAGGRSWRARPASKREWERASPAPRGERRPLKDPLGAASILGSHRPDRRTLLRRSGTPPRPAGPRPCSRRSPSLVRGWSSSSRWTQRFRDRGRGVPPPGWRSLSLLR